MLTRAKINELRVAFFGAAVLTLDAICSLFRRTELDRLQVIRSGCLRGIVSEMPECRLLLVPCATTAIARGDLETFRELVEEVGVGMNPPQDECWLMVSLKYPACVEYLLANGYPVEGTYAHFTSSLIGALHCDADVRSVVALIKHGADVNKHVQLVTPLVIAILTGNVINAMLLISAGARFGNMTVIGNAIQDSPAKTRLYMLKALAKRGMNFQELNAAVVDCMLCTKQFATASYLVDHNAPVMGTADVVAATRGASTALCCKLIDRNVMSNGGPISPLARLLRAVQYHSADVIESVIDHVDTSSERTVSAIAEAMFIHVHGYRGLPGTARAIRCLLKRGFRFEFTPENSIRIEYVQNSKLLGIICASGARNLHAPRDVELSPNASADWRRVSYKHGMPSEYYTIDDTETNKAITKTGKRREALIAAVVDHVGTDVAEIIADCLAIPHGRRRKLYEAEMEEARVQVFNEYQAEAKRRRIGQEGSDPRLES